MILHPKLLEELERFRIHIQPTSFSHFRLNVKVVIEWAMMAHRATLPCTTKHMSCTVGNGGARAGYLDMNPVQA
jgi:hypothetical protein